ncbi:MAG: divalent-cation tolerance protein CutA [Bryobacteraceae bacterium]
MTDKIVVFTACGSPEEARNLARHLVEVRVAACVNVVPGALSFFRWEGEISESPEWLLIIKTTRPRLDELKLELRRIHSYTVPEVVALPIVDGSDDYLNWIEREVS